MSLDARFTLLRRSVDRSRPRGQPANYQRNQPPRERLSSLKNRLLAMEMADRPNVVAALSRGRARLRRGAGFNGDIILPIPRSRSRQRQGPLRRSNSVGRLARAQSMESLMSIGGSESGFGFRRGSGRRGGRGGPGGFRSRGIVRGSRLSARGGIQKLNMDLVATARKRRSASLSRLGNSFGVGVLRRGRGGPRQGGGIANLASLLGGIGGGVKDRLGVRPASMNRSASLGNLNVRGGRGRSRGASAGRGGVRGNLRQQRGGTLRQQRGGAVRQQRGALIRRGGNSNANVRGGGGRGRAGIRGNRRGNVNGSLNRGGFKNKRGAVRARGNRRGGRQARGGQTKTTPPSKEDLDNELDQYMSNTRSYLDKQLDQYMAEPTA